jgi:hypothetical protein
MNVSALTTDFYELTMMQGYFSNNHNPQVVFDMFYRTNPFEGGYVVFSGLNDLIDKLEHFTFSSEDIAYLESLGKFTKPFLTYLETYRFEGDLYAMQEGTVVFPGEPLVRILQPRPADGVRAQKGPRGRWGSPGKQGSLHRRVPGHQQHIGRKNVRHPGCGHHGSLLDHEL